MKKIFNPQHLDQVEESYFDHFKFSVLAGLQLVALGILSMIHGIFPFLFSRYPDQLFEYFLVWSQARRARVDRILAEKNLERK
jgi:hypothetical protein